MYKISKNELLNRFVDWDSFLKRKVHLIACGGTAMTLLGVKESTKDIDLMVPIEKEREYLLKLLLELGYKNVTGWGWARDDGFVFDLFRGKSIHTTELLESPLDMNNHVLVKEFSHIYLGVLNTSDILISKLFRSTQVDVDDCLMLVKHEGSRINWKALEARYRDTAAYDVSEGVVMKNWEHFVRQAKEKGLYHEE